MQLGASKHEVAGLTWDQVRERLAAGSAAILPIGAGAKQHGLHMPMATDQLFAEYFSRALAERIDALIWPTLTYGFYPAFVAYAGSVSLSP
jgi:creatinine amidohydrolase